MLRTSGLVLLGAVLPLLAQPPSTPPAAGASPVVSAEPPAPDIPRFRAAAGISARTVPVFVRYGPGVEPIPLLPDEVEVREDGVKATVLSIEPYAAPPRETSADAPPAATVPPRAAVPGRPQLFYFDATLLGTTSLPAAARAAAARAATLASRGPVEIVVADPSPRRVAGPLASAAEIEAAFARVAERFPGRDRLLAMRLRYAEAPAREQRLQASMAWAEESVLIRSCLGKVASYVGGRADADGGLLFLVSDGFQIGPSDAIESLLRDRSGTVGQASGGLPAGIPSLTITGELKRVIHEVTARGWVFLPWSPSGGGGRGDLGSAASVVRRSVDDPVLGARGAEEVQALSNPLEPLRSMADASGSEVLLHADGLERTDALLSGLHLLTYSVDRVRDGGVHRIDVSSLVPGVTVRSPRALSAGTPEWSAAARARRRAEGGAPEGALRVEASVESPRKKLSGRIETRVDLAPLLPTLRVLGEGRLRVTVAFLEEGREPFVRQEARPLPREEFARTWIWEAPIEALPAKGRLVVDVEELTTGEHGSSSIALPLPKEP